MTSKEIKLVKQSLQGKAAQSLTLDKFYQTLKGDLKKTKQT